jgi:hypothetical protein
MQAPSDAITEIQSTHFALWHYRQLLKSGQPIAILELTPGTASISRFTAETFPKSKPKEKQIRRVAWVCAQVSESVRVGHVWKWADKYSSADLQP